MVPTDVLPDSHKIVCDVLEKPSSVGTLSQAVNFTCYQMFKTQLSAYLGRDELASWQHMVLGGLSGGIGPCVNNPLDVVKTRLQKQVSFSAFFSTFSTAHCCHPVRDMNRNCAFFP